MAYGRLLARRSIPEVVGLRYNLLKAPRQTTIKLADEGNIL
ncbi:MAG: hypothetical protein Q6366_001750 [Candidatus Freyarchaeota archaeon]